MNIDKLNFVASGFLPLLNNLDAGAKGKWGKMNGQQMVEHLTHIALNQKIIQV